MRISRALAMAGLASRRQCEIFVRNGAVVVNGEVVRDLGRQVELSSDTVLFRGKLVVPQRSVYYLLNKPEGYVVSASESFAKKHVYDLLPASLVRGTRQGGSRKTRVFPVGRLDKDSMGLLLFTNDGDLAYRLTHPKFHVGKLYEVRLSRPFDLRDRAKLLHGVMLEDGIARAEKVRPVTKRVIQMLLHEGRNREVRRMMETLSYEVERLIRLAFGPLFLGALAPGKGRVLSHAEIRSLKQAVGLESGG